MGQLDRSSMPPARLGTTVLLLAAWSLWLGNAVRLTDRRIEDPEATETLRVVLHAEARGAEGSARAHEAGLRVVAEGRARCWSILALNEGALFVDELRIRSQGRPAEGRALLELELQVRTRREDAALVLEDEATGQDSLFEARDPGAAVDIDSSPLRLRLDRFRPHIRVRLPLAAGTNWRLWGRSIDIAILGHHIVPAGPTGRSSLEAEALCLDRTDGLRIEVDGQCLLPRRPGGSPWLLGDAGFRVTADRDLRLQLHLRGPRPDVARPHLEVLAIGPVDAGPPGRPSATGDAGPPGRLIETGDGAWICELELGAGRSLAFALRFPSPAISPLASHSMPMALHVTAALEAITVD